MPEWCYYLSIENQLKIRYFDSYFWGDIKATWQFNSATLATIRRISRRPNLHWISWCATNSRDTSRLPISFDHISLWGLPCLSAWGFLLQNRAKRLSLLWVDNKRPRSVVSLWGLLFHVPKPSSFSVTRPLKWTIIKSRCHYGSE